MRRWGKPGGARKPRALKSSGAPASARRRSVRGRGSAAPGGGVSCVPAPDLRSPSPARAARTWRPAPSGPAARRAQRRQRRREPEPEPERGARRCGARAGARAGRSRRDQLNTTGAGAGPDRDGAAAVPGAPGPSAEGLAAHWGRLAGEDQGAGGLAEGLSGSRRVSPTS